MQNTTRELRLSILLFTLVTRGVQLNLEKLRRPQGLLLAFIAKCRRRRNAGDDSYKKGSVLAASLRAGEALH